MLNHIYIFFKFVFLNSKALNIHVKCNSSLIMGVMPILYSKSLTIYIYDVPYWIKCLYTIEKICIAFFQAQILGIGHNIIYQCHSQLLNICLATTTSLTCHL